VEEKVNAIKVDVEGYEGDVLQGAEETIRKYKPNLLVEFHPTLRTKHSHSNIYNFISKNYSKINCYEVSSGGGVMQKIKQRYVGRKQVSKIPNIDRLISCCDKGERKKTFWVTANNG
jgi:hypothetical protein